MKAAAFYISLPFIYLVALLPFPLLYALSDVMFAVLYGLVGYRRKVVRDNLKNSFPEKSVADLRRIERAYYRHLCDLILETFKLLGMRRSELLRRCRITNYEVFYNVLRQHRSIVVALGHHGNWEWAGAATAAHAESPLFVIYRPLSNKFFDGLMLQIRKRFGAVPVSAKDILRKLYSTRHEVSITAFLADQTPSPEHAHWTNFLHQQTPVFEGTEKIAKKFNYPVGFGKVKKIKRGYYEVELQILTEEPMQTQNEEITELHTKALEQCIIEQPETWLWSHRRWKHKPPVFSDNVTSGV